MRYEETLESVIRARGSLESHHGFDVNDIVIAVGGVLMIVFHRAFAEHTARFWNANFNLGYGERAVRWLKWSAVIGGLAFIGFGLRRFL